MKTFIVRRRLIIPESHEFEVKAENLAEAELIAMSMACTDKTLVQSHSAEDDYIEEIFEKEN